MSTADAERSFSLLMFSDEERVANDRKRAAAEQERMAELERRCAEDGVDIFGWPLPSVGRQS